MAGSAHDVLIVTFREQPSLLASLVEKLRGVSLPRRARPVDTAVRFTKPAEVRVDLLLEHGPRRWTIVELQRGIDWAKRRRWILAAGLLIDQTGALGDILVITARRAVASWAGRVALLRTRLGTELHLKPVVFNLGEHVEALLDEERPELALLAAWAMQHRHGAKAREVVERAIELTGRLPRPLQQAQHRAILSVLSKRLLAFLQEAALNPDKIPETPAARRFRLLMEAEGLKKGLAAGEAKGEAKGLRESLLMLLEAHGVTAAREDKERIRACTDATTLKQWFERAVTAESMREVFRAQTATATTRKNRARKPRAADPQRV